MLWNKETFQLRLMLVVAVLFIISAVKSCEEIRYTIFGKETVATITDVKPVMGRRSGSSGQVSLTYTFVDEGTKRTEKDRVSSEFEPFQDAAGQSAVAIQYIPGSPDASRIPSAGRWILIGLFLAALAALTVVTVRFWKEYQAHERRNARNNAGW